MWQELTRFTRDYILPRKGKFVLVQTMHVVATGLLLTLPLLVGYVIDAASEARDFTPLLLGAGLVLGLSGLWAVVHGLKEWWGHEVAQSTTSGLRDDLYSHMQKLSMSFHDDKKTGELISRLVDDINVIQEFVHHGPETIIVGIFTVVGTAGVLFYKDWRLALAAMLVAPIILLFARAMAGPMLKQFREVRSKKATLSDVLEENLAGIRVIKAFTGEDRESRAVREANREHYSSRMGAIRYIATLFPGAMLLNNVAMAVVLFFGGYRLMAGAITGGTLAAFVLYMQRFYRPILRMVMMIERGSRFFAGIERFHDYRDIEPDIQDAPDAVSLDQVRGEVAFESVDFSYEEETVLKDINLTAEPGQMVALVGPSGAGKTTITRLIPRFYDPDSGRVLLDGQDIRELRLRSLRSHIGVVMQDDFLFSGTVAENIGYGRPRAGREEIEEAALQANAHSFVQELPDGYETVVGKRGVKLSEGQRQRVSVARALLKNPQILILDEATSSVDSETEMLIQQAVERLREGRTTFAIAHRLSTVLEAEQILFIQNGRIIERGTHAELMGEGGEYARFYRIQFEQMASPDETPPVEAAG